MNTRPCYYDDGIVCDDCTGEPRRCFQLMQQDQAADDE